MADNTPLNSGTGGDTIATDDLATVNGAAVSTPVKVQRVKAGFGADGELRDVDAVSRGMPVDVPASVFARGGLPVYDDTLAQAILSTGSDPDQRSLLDVLDPLGPNYVMPPCAPAGIEMTGQRDAAQSLPVVMARDQANVTVIPFGVAGGYSQNTPLPGIVDVSGSKSVVVTLDANSPVTLYAYFSLNGKSWGTAATFFAEGGAVSASTGVSNANYTHIFQTVGKYFKLVPSSTGNGTISGAIGLLQSVPVQQMQVQQSSSANLNCNATANINLLLGQNVAASAASAGNLSRSNYNVLYTGGFQGATSGNGDVTAQIITASGNTGVVDDFMGGGFSATAVFSAVSGTSPTLDLILQESPDGGATNWVDIYHCERVTANSTIVVPNMPTMAARRWSWAVSGTTPSFMLNLRPTRGATAPYPLTRQFFDRTAGLLSGTLNATSSAYQVQGCKSLMALVTIGAATTPGTYQLQISHDKGANWVAASAAVPAVASSTVAIPMTAGYHGRHARVICTSAATGQTGTVVSFSGSN